MNNEINSSYGMSYTTFESIINRMIKHSQNIQKAYDLKIDLMDVFDDQGSAIETLWEELLTQEGTDWLWWYLYEKDGISGKPKKDLKAWDEGGKVICKDVEGLWKYLIKSRYFKNQN